MLFVSGLEATGKTHLSHAVCHKVNEKQSSIYLDLAQAFKRMARGDI